MKRFSSVTLGVAILMAATSVLASDAASVGRRASRQDILAGHASTSSSSAASMVIDRSEQAVLDGGLVPNQPVIPPEIDVLGTVVKTQAGLFLEGTQVDLEVRRTETQSSIRLDRVSMDPNEMGEAMATKIPSVRPFIDLPILAGN